MNDDCVTITCICPNYVIPSTKNMQTLGMSNLGHSSGTSGVVTGKGVQFIFVGGSNVTLVQSLLSSSGTITINAGGGSGSFSQSVQTQDMIDATLAGNTAGVLALMSSGTITIAGGDNITLSQVGNAFTIIGASASFSQSVQTQNMINATLGGNTAGVLALMSSGTVTIVGGNNITLSQVGNAFTISGANQSSFTQSVQTQSLINASLAGNTAGVLALMSSGTITIAGGNNITLSQVGNAFTISAANQSSQSFSQSVQTQNNVDLTLSGNTSGVLALISSGTATLAGGNNITLSQAGNAITISGANTVAQTNQTVGLYAVSNTTLSTSGTVDARTLSFQGAGIASVGISNGSVVISVPASATAGDGYNIIAAGTQTANSTGTIVFSNSNGITFGMNNSSIVTASYTQSTFSQTVQTQNNVDLTLSGNTSGTLALVSSGTLTLAGGNNITLSQVGNAVTISGANTVAQSVQTQNLVDVTLSGNTSGTLALVSSGTLTLAGGNNITLSQVGNAVTISGVNTVAQSNQSIGLYAVSNTTLSTSGTVDARTLSFEGAGGVSVGVSNGSIVISGATGGGGGDGYNIIAAGTQTAASTGTVVFSNSNGITFGMSDNSIVTASYTQSTFSQTVQTQNNVDVTLSGNTSGALALISSGTMTLAGGNNITLSQAGNAVTISAGNAGAAGNNTYGMSNIGNTSGTTGVVSGSAIQFLLAGGNNVTLSQSLDGVSGTITISAFSQTPQSVQTQNLVDVTLSGNTSGALALISSGTMTLAGGNNITLSQAGNAITISAASQTPQSVQTQNMIAATLSGNTSGALALISSGTMTLAGGNNITLSQAGNAVTISAANTVAQTNQTLGLYAVSNTTQSTSMTANATNLSFHGAGVASVGASNGSIIISVPSGGGGITNMNFSAGTTSQNLSNIVFSNSNGVSFGLNGSTITASAAGGAGGGYTASSYNPYAGMVMQFAGANSNATMTIQPYQMIDHQFDRLVMAVHHTNNAASSGSLSVSIWVGVYTRNADTLSLASSTSTSYGLTASGTVGSYSQFSSARQVSIGSTNTISAGDYWVAVVHRTSSAVAAMGFSFLLRSGIYASSLMGPIGVGTAGGTNATNQWLPGLGIYSVSTNGIPDSIAFSEIYGGEPNYNRQPFIYFLSQSA